MNQEYIISTCPNGSVYIHIHVGDDIHYFSRMITIQNAIITVLYT